MRFLSLLLMVAMSGCGNSASQDVGVDSRHNEKVELDPIANSTLVLCEVDEAETILYVTISAVPHWPGYSWEFPLKKPAADDGWMSSGYVCSIGPHGFYGYVSIGDATNDAIPIEVSVTYDHRVNLNNDLTERFDVPLRASGEMSFPNEWLAVWSWKDPQKAVAEQNAEPELPITGF